MNACNFRAPNGENSLLFAGLEQLIGTEKAAVIWNQIYSDEFKLQYGDWISSTPAYKYQGGFENTGKGTSKGDGKDKAMRDISQVFIGELAQPGKSSSTNTSYRKFPEKQSLAFDNGVMVYSKYDNLKEDEPVTVMLARNSEFKGKPLSAQTKAAINQHKDDYFVVGDMPGVDSQFIDYLKGIGAKFVIYHTGTTPRIKSKSTISVDPNGEPTLDWVKEKLKLDTQVAEIPAAPPPAEPVVITLEDLTKTKGNPTEETIVANVHKLYEQAAADPTTIYKLDLPGNSKEKIRLADKKSISMLKLAAIIDSRPMPHNVRLSDAFTAILENTPRRFLSNIIYQENSMFSPTIYDEKLFEKQIAENFVPVRNNDFTKTGAYFDAEMQSEVSDSIVLMMYGMMTKEDEIRKKRSTVSSYRNDILARFTNTQKVYAERGNEKMAHELQLIINSFDASDGLSFWRLAIQRLNDYGIKIKEDQFAEEEPDTTAATKLLTAIADDIFKEESGHGLSDWSDNHFEHDPKDTASARIKYFMATVFDSEVGNEEQPRKIGLPFNDAKTRSKIVKGQKVITTRTAEEVEKLNLPTSTNQDVTATVEGTLFRVTFLRRATSTDVEANAANIKAEEGTDLQVGDYMYIMEPYVAKENVVRSNLNYLGLPKLAPFEQLYNDTLGVLADQDKSIDNYIAILRSEGNKFKPNLRALADKLERAPKNIQNEFVSVMSLHYNEFTMILLDQKADSTGRPYYVLRPINANRASQVNVIKENWKQNQKFAPILKRNAAGITVVNAEKAAELQAELDAVNQLYAAGNKEADKKAQELMKKVFEYNGITMPDKAIDNFVSKTSNWTKKTSVAGNFRRQFEFSKDGKPLGIISTLVAKLNGRVDDNDVEDSLEDRSFTFNNPLYTEDTSMSILGRLAAAYTASLYSNTHRSSEKKTIYDYGFHSSLTRSVKRLQTDEVYRSKFAEAELSRNSFLLTRINNNEKLRNKMNVTFLDGLKAINRPNAEGIVRDKMSDREQLLTALALFQNRGNSEFAHYISLTHSDKTTTPVLENMPRIENVTTTKPGIDKLSGMPSLTPVFSEEVYTEMFNVFHSEYDRIQRASQHDYNNPKYQKGSQYFYFMQEFNYDRLSAAVKKGEVPEGVLEALYNDKKQLNAKEYPKFKDAVRHLIIKRLNDLTANTMNEWKKNKILSDTEKFANVPFDRKYLNRLLRSVGIRFVKPDLRKEGHGAAAAAMGIDPNNGSFVDGANNIIADTEAYSLAAHLAARDYAVNSFLMNVSMSQLLYGDPAQVWKGSVRETMVEYGKRLAKDIAPGREGAFAQGEQYLTVTVKDFKTNAGYLAGFESLKAAYAEGNPLEASDAQELTTVLEHIYVMYKLGRISEETYQEMKAIVDKANGNYYEFTDPHHKDVIMQPMKPVYAGDRDVVNGAILNDYVKSSSYPLYPALTVGKELDKVRRAMEKGGIARLNFSSAKKIGGPNDPVDLFASDGKVDEAIFKSESWSGVDANKNTVPSARQQLSRDNFRIQQEVPYDETKESIRTVSQMNKLITEGISQIDTEFSIGEQKLTAPQLIEMKADIRKKLFDINKQRLYDEIGAVVKQGNVVFSDRNKLFSALRKRILTGQTDFTANDLAYVNKSNIMENSDELIIPLMFAPSASKFELMLMSMVNEIANIPMPGKSYIQSSPAGHQMVKKFEDMTEAEKKNIIWTEGYDGKALKTLRHDENGNALAAQVLVPFDFVLRGKRLNILKYTKQTEDGRTIIDYEKIPKELLQLVAARIPNQGHNSMLPIEIVGFVPDNMGDLMIVPAAITKQMGSDFDVDKLYTYHRAFESKEGKLQVINNDDDKEATLKNQYFDIHWAVLMNGKMTEKILKPLDKPDLKEEGKWIEAQEQKRESQVDFYDPIYQLNDFQAQKDAKQLVGLSSLSTTFNSVIQDKNLQPGFTTFDEFGTVDVPVPITIVDKNNKRRELSVLSGYGTSEYNSAPRTKHDNHTTVQSEVLDYAKNKVSDKVHLNTYTYAASAALTQLQEADSEDGPGWAASLDYNSRLLSQPIIKEYVQEMSRQGDSLENAYNPKLKETVIQQLIRKYAQIGLADKSIEELITGADFLGYNDLTDVLVNGEKSKFFHVKQIQAMLLFQQLDSIGTEMTKAQSLINHDTKGAGSSLLALIGQATTKQTVESGVNGTAAAPVLLGASALFTDENKTQTEQGELYDTIHDSAFGIVGEFFPYVELMPVFEFITEQTNRQNISLDTQKNVFNALKSYIFSHPKLGLWENPEAARATLLFTKNDQPSLAERVQKAKETWGQKNYLLSRLQTNVDPDNLHPSTVSYIASKATSLDDSENTKAWIDLLRSADAEKRKLGEDLVKYTFITGGNQDANNFIKYVPYSYLLGTDMGIRLNELTHSIKELVMTDNFKTQWFQHNPWAAIGLSQELTELGGLEQYPEYFELPTIVDEGEVKSDDPTSKLVISIKTPKAKIKAYPDFLSYRSTAENKWILYRKDDKLSGKYVRIDTLGSKDTDEYSYNEGITSKRSLVAENRSKAYDNLQGVPRMLNGINGVLVNTYDEKGTFEKYAPDAGGYNEMKQLLRKIADDVEIPNYLRVVSDFLEKTMPLGEQQDALAMMLAGSGPVPAFKFQFSNARNNFGAQMDSFERELTYDTSSIGNSRITLAQYTNHEIIHDRTALVTLMSEDEEYLMKRGGPAQTQFMMNSWDTYSKKNPEVIKHIADLHEVRKQALEQLKKDMERDGYPFEQIQNMVLRGTMPKTPWNKLVYALSSNTEFIAHALSEYEVMAYLNKVEYKGERQSVLQRVLDIVRSLISAIGSEFGMKVEPNSALERAIQVSLELMTVKKIDERGPEMLSHPNNMAHMFTQGALKSTVLTAADRVIGKLEEQRQDLIHSLTGRLSKEDRADKHAKIDKMETDIQELKDSQDLNMIGEIGKRHLGWVRTILSQDEPSLAQVMTADRVVETWSNLVELVYGRGSDVQDTDPTFAQINADATQLKTILVKKMEQQIIKVSAGTVRMKDFDSSELRDVTTDQSYTRALSSAAESKVTQYLATYMETTGRHVAEETNKFLKELEARKIELEKSYGNLKPLFDKFIQENDSDTAFGLVQRYSQDWYDFRRTLRGKRQGTLKRINESNMPAAEAAKAKREAWKKYWTEINDNAVFADTRLLFDEATGDLKTDSNAAAHRSELEKEIGKDATDDLISQARERYLKYLERKQSHFENLESEVAGGAMTEDQAAFEMKEFIYRYSPNVFFNNFKSKLGEFKDVNTDYYAKMAPKRKGTFYDAKFEEIQQDEQLKEFYNWYNEQLGKLKAMLPLHIQNNLSANFLPVVGSDMFRDFYSNLLHNPAYLKTLTKQQLDKFSASKWEEGLAEREHKQIPIDYINDEKVPLADRSRDLIGILQVFGAMAYHYKNFAEAKDFIDMGEAVLTYHHQARTGGASQQIEVDGRITTVKDGLKNTLDAFRYTKEYLMFKRARKLEGKLGEVKNKKVRKLLQERYDLEQQLQTGEGDPSEVFKRIEEINEELAKPENIGRTFYVSKIGDRFIRFNQLKTLSYNPFSAVVNVTFGLVSAQIHANGGKDFTRGELARAYRNMGGSFAKWASAGTIESDMAYKMLAIMDRLGVIGDYVDSHYGEFETRDRKPGWQRRLNPFALMRSGDYFMKALTTNAMLLNQKVKVTEDGVEKEISLLDALDEDGNWNTEKYGENKAWSSEDVNEQKAWDKFRNRVIRVNVIVHGNQDKNSPKLMNKYILGRLLGQFRSSWLPEGWNSRFQKEHFDMQLDRDVKGRYVTIWQLGFAGYFRVLTKQLASLIGKVDPYTGIRRSDGKPMSEVDIENMRRNLSELAFILGTAAIIMMLRASMEDDDDKKPGIQFAINMLLRSQQDMLFYSSPQVFENITRNVIPSTQVLTDGIKAIKAVTRYMTDSDYEADKVWKAIFRAGLPVPQATLVPKMDYMLNKDLGNLQR